MIVGVIGLGSIGMVHAKNLLAMGHEVIGWDPDQLRGEMLVLAGGKLSPEEPPYKFETLHKCDAVVIAAPSDQHLSHLRNSTSRKRPTFVEKPLAGGEGFSDVSYAEKVLAEAKSLVMVAQNMRYHPVVKLAKEQVDRRGPPQEAWFRILQKNTKYTDPVILNWGAHEVDMALYLVDKDLRFDVGDVTQDRAIFSLKSKQSHVGIHLDYLSEPWVRDFALHWPEASLYADVQNFKMEIFQTEAGEIVSREVIAVEGSHEQTYVDEMKEFIRRVEGHSSDGIGATGEDGLRCLKVLLEAQNA